MERSQEPTKIPILGEESIIIDNQIWGRYIAEDLLRYVPSESYLLATDDHLHAQYCPNFEKAFNDVATRLGSLAKLQTYIIRPGETSKSRATKAAVEDWMLSKERDPPLDTKSVIIALGGGVIGDLFGFVAATFKRGIRFVNVPTSLLSMVDSSIGGKTAIDTPVNNVLSLCFRIKLLSDTDYVMTGWQEPYRCYLATFEDLHVRESYDRLCEHLPFTYLWPRRIQFESWNVDAELGSS